VFVAGDDPVKLTLLTLTNHTGRPRSLTVTAYAELVLGTDRTQTSRHILTDIDEETNALLVRNPWSTEYPDQVVFLDLAGRQQSWTGDRREFLGQHGTPELPLAVVNGRPLSGAVGPGRDPCAALQQRIVLEPGGHAEVLMVLGAGRDVAEVRELVARYREIDPRQVLDDVRGLWRRRVSRVQVRTPSSAFDVMMNGWLLYQTLACRMLARSGYYQASGAYGFRDQLQDSMTVVLVDPAMARSHLLRAAGRQFLEGDVQHWWLPASGRGVRTRISDDVVWLAHALCRYVHVTGDITILDEQVPFIEGPPLSEDQDESFFQPSVSNRSAPLFDHCVLGLEHAFRYGRHGLPLIGTGDWNDGMNRVGAAGEGESVWLGWFLHTTLTEFAALARAHRDPGFADRCRQQQTTLLAAEPSGVPSSNQPRRYQSPSQASRSSAPARSAACLCHCAARAASPRSSASGANAVSVACRNQPSQTLSPLPCSPTRFMPSFQSPVPNNGNPCSPTTSERSIARQAWSNTVPISEDRTGAINRSSSPSSSAGPVRYGACSSHRSASPVV
jgi:cyclic beta-1,2-glucan synthetase